MTRTPASKPNSQLQLAVLGPLRVVRNGEQVELPRSKKARALLAYLGLTGRAHTRSQLCEMFWDVADDPRNGLRWCLSRLRSVANREDIDILQADRKSVALAKDHVVVDMRAIEQRLRSVDEPSTAELEHMAGLFRGSFLEGLDIADLHALQAWLIANRSAARELQVQLLTRLVDRLDDDPVAALPHVRSLLRVAPHVEQWHAKHVALLMAAGRRQEAAEHYDAGLRELETHGVTTHGLRMRWRRLQATSATATPSAGALDDSSGSPFVGRQSEIELLDALLGEALAGAGGTLTIAGEPGIGKSRLVGELARRAGRRGVRVLEGKCADTGHVLPYLPFVEALDDAARDLPHDVLQAQTPLLARILPGLAQQRGLPIGGAASEDADRYAVFRAVAALLDELAADDGLVLVLEDLHWADTQSLLMLTHLARMLGPGRGGETSRTLVVATYRDVEVSRTHPLRDTLTALKRESGFHRVALRALDGDAAKQLIEQLSHASSKAVDAIYAQTEGHPLFIEEVVKHLVEERTLAGEDGAGEGGAGEDGARGDRARDDSAAGGFSLPEGVRDVIGRRLSRMSERCNRMLANASAIPGDVHWPLLAGVCNGDEDELLDALDEALAAQLVRERPGARGGNYEFTHALIRQSLYEELSTSRRARLHKKIGDAIEQVYGSDLDAHLVSLAHHYFEAAPIGELDKFVDYSMRAGQQAMKLMAFEEAAQLYERALATLDELDAEPAVGVRGQLHDMHAKALATMSRWPDANVHFELALKHLPPNDDLRRARLLLHAAVCAFWMLDIEAVRAHADAALVLAQRCDDQPSVAAATGLLAQAAMSDGDLKTAAQRYAAARDRGGASADLLVAQAVQQYPISLYWAANFDGVASEGIELLKVARSHSDGSMVMNLLSVLALAHGCAGRYRQSAAMFREAEQFGRDHGIERLLARAACMQTGCLVDLGALDLAQAQAEDALEKARRVDFAPSVVSAQLDLLMLTIARGQVDDAEAQLPGAESALVDTKGFHTWVWSLRVCQARAQIALLRGELADSAAHAERLVKDARRLGRGKYEVIGQRVLAAVQHAEQRDDDAASLLRDAAANARAMPYPALFIQVVGDLLAVSDDRELAGEAAKQVDAIAEELDDDAQRRAFEASEAVQRIRAR